MGGGLVVVVQFDWWDGGGGRLGVGLIGVDVGATVMMMNFWVCGLILFVVV